MTFPAELRTSRMRLRRWRQDDLEPLARILGQEDVARYIWGESRTPEQSGAILGRQLEHWDRHGFGFWAAELSHGDLAGWVGLEYVEWSVHLASQVEIGWMFAPEHWGKGLATEGAVAALDAGFEELGLERVIGVHHPENTRSRRVMERLGMQEAGETPDPADESVALALRSITREAWERHRLEYAGRTE